VVGRELGRALILAAIFAPAPAFAGSIELEVGSPFTQLAATASISESLRWGGRLQLLDARALRVGPTIALRGPSIGPIDLSTELDVSRSFGLSVVSSFDAQLTESIALRLDDRSTAVLTFGAIGVVGPSRPQTVLLGTATLGVETQLDDAWSLGFELGWLASPRDDRPRGGVRLRRSF
jgi:hypothetical protein